MGDASFEIERDGGKCSIRRVRDERFTGKSFDLLRRLPSARVTSGLDLSCVEFWEAAILEAVKGSGIGG